MLNPTGSGLGYRSSNITEYVSPSRRISNADAPRHEIRHREAPGHHQPLEPRHDLEPLQGIHRHLPSSRDVPQSDLPLAIPPRLPASQLPARLRRPLLVQSPFRPLTDPLRRHTVLEPGVRLAGWTARRRLHQHARVVYVATRFFLSSSGCFKSLASSTCSRDTINISQRPQRADTNYALRQGTSTPPSTSSPT